MDITRLRAKIAFRRTLLFSVLIILLNLYGNSMEDLNYEFVKKFLSFSGDNSQIDCESIFLGFFDKDNQDTIEMDKERSIVVLPSEEHAIYLDPTMKIDSITHTILRHLNDGNSTLKCYFGTYTRNMRFSPFIQTINITGNTVYVKYFYKEVKFELNMVMDNQFNLELQSVTIDAPNNKEIKMYSQFTLDTNADQFSFLDLTELIGEDAQEALEYIKEQVKVFTTFNSFLENIGVSEQTQELLSDAQSLLK